MRILIYIVYGIIGIFLYNLIKSFFAPKNIPLKKDNLKIDDEMVQDPNCGVYIPKKETIEKKVKGVKYFFCSKECFEEFSKKSDNPQDHKTG